MLSTHLRSPLIHLLMFLAFASATYAQHGTVRLNVKDSAAMVFIGGGEFVMGSDEAEIISTWKRLDWDEKEVPYTKSERPAHHVKVDGFWMYQCLVTVAQYRRYCRATGRQMPEAPSYGWRENNPIVNVSWQDAYDYCKWAGGRLPYEAEWEYAARAGNTGLGRHPRTVFIWGDSLPTRPSGNLADESFKISGYYDSPGFHHFAGYRDGYVTASPVQAFPPNGFGLYDMAGNVLEWCADWYDAEYYTHSHAQNPHGPASGTRKVLRGGAFDTTPTITRIARRLGNYPKIRNNEKGFRCVMN
jgi:sulfatase modifying factor 1